MRPPFSPAAENTLEGCREKGFRYFPGMEPWTGGIVRADTRRWIGEKGFEEESSSGMLPVRSGMQGLRRI